MLDRVDIIIRLEFHNHRHLFLTNSDLRPKLELDYLALHVAKYRPLSSARMALNASPELNSMAYTHTRSMHRSYPLAGGQQQISMDQLFNNLIPQRLCIVFIDSSAFGGSYAKNALYFRHNDLACLTTTVNDRAFYNVSSSFLMGRLTCVINTTDIRFR